MFKENPNMFRIRYSWRVSVVIMLLITAASPLFAADKRKLNAVQDMVEYTLSQLTKSVEAVSERNQRLISEIESLRQQIPEARKKLIAVTAQRENLRGRNVKMMDLGRDEKDEITVHQTKVERVTDNIDTLKFEIVELERRVKAKQTEEENIKRGIQANELEINRLKREMGVLEEFSKPAHMFRLKNDETLRAYRASQQRIVKLEVALETTQKRYQQSSANMLAFESKQQLLKERITIIKDEMAGAVEEKRQMERQVEKIRRQDENTDPLIGEIAVLERREKELKKILTQAREKLETNQIDFASFGSEQVKLEDDLKVIEQERMDLERQLTMLQSVPSGT